MGVFDPQTGAWNCSWPEQSARCPFREGCRSALSRSYDRCSQSGVLRATVAGLGVEDYFELRGDGIAHEEALRGLPLYRGEEHGTFLADRDLGVAVEQVEAAVEAGMSVAFYLRGRRGELRHDQVVRVYDRIGEDRYFLLVVIPHPDEFETLLDRRERDRPLAAIAERHDRIQMAPDRSQGPFE
jgi:DNA-binding Lrp family transcriptional regulator